MKSVDDLALTVLSSLSQSVCVCVQVGDAVDHLKACSRFEGMEWLKCVDQLLEDVTPDPAQSQTPNWIISETTSPADYQPQIAALTMARGPPRQLVGGPISEQQAASHGPKTSQPTPQKRSTTCCSIDVREVDQPTPKLAVMLAEVLKSPLRFEISTKSGFDTSTSCLRLSHLGAYDDPSTAATHRPDMLGEKAASRNAPWLMVDSIRQGY
jgi:hypothetical protein